MIVSLLLAFILFLFNSLISKHFFVFIIEFPTAIHSMNKNCYCKLRYLLIKQIETEQILQYLLRHFHRQIL